jgi:TFIIF-interacting CTD phosphatase-like protein
MSKKTTSRRNTPKEQGTKLHNISKKVSHTGGQPLVEHINDPNSMVTQKVRKAQEGRSSWFMSQSRILNKN